MTAETTMQTTATIPRITKETKFGLSSSACRRTSVSYINSIVMNGAYYIALV